MIEMHFREGNLVTVHDSCELFYVWEAGRVHAWQSNALPPLPPVLWWSGYDDERRRDIEGSIKRRWREAVDSGRPWPIHMLVPKGEALGTSLGKPLGLMQ